MIDELSDRENIVLECAQEADKRPDIRAGMIDADAVATYASDNGIFITKNGATKLLSRLARWGLLIHQPRASRGWGQGWFEARYSLAPTARIA